MPDELLAAMRLIAPSEEEAAEMVRMLTHGADASVLAKAQFTTDTLTPIALANEDAARRVQEILKKPMSKRQPEWKRCVPLSRVKREQSEENRLARYRGVLCACASVIEVESRVDEVLVDFWAELRHPR